ncbi:MAG: ADP-ribosyltransferase [Candidatus Gastranaerophilales bacterium]
MTGISKIDSFSVLKQNNIPKQDLGFQSEPVSLEQKPDNFELQGEKKGVSTGAKVGIGALIATGLAVAADFLIYKGKHVDDLWKNLRGTSDDITKKGDDVVDDLKPNTNKVEVQEKAAQEAREKAAQEAREKAAKEAQEKAAKKAQEKAAKEAQEEADELLWKNLQDENDSLEAFGANLKFKSNDEISKISEDIDNRYYTIYNKARIAKEDKYHITNKNIESYMEPFEQYEFRILEKKRSYINQHQKEVKDRLYNKLLKRDTDSTISTAHGSSYLTRDQSMAFGEYYDAYPYNDYLRKGKINPSEIENITHMDEGFRLAPPLEKKAVVYRAVCAPSHMSDRLQFMNSIQEGAVIKDASYVSTSINNTHAQFRQFAEPVVERSENLLDGVLMRINLPKGTKGVLGGYDEFVLPRNSQIKINKIDIIDGVKVADCEYILPNNI